MKTSAEEMEKWWRKHYKDAADGVPYDSGEGGYQYVNGGPEDPMEVLQEEFPNADFDDVEALATKLDTECPWVKEEDY